MHKTISLLLAVCALSACAVDTDITTRLVVGRAIGASAVVVVGDNDFFDTATIDADGRFAVEVGVGRSLAVRFYDEGQRSLGHAVFPATRSGDVLTQVIPPGPASIDLGDVTIDPAARACFGRPTSDSPLASHDHDNDGVVDVDDDDAVAFARMVDSCGPPVSVVR
jgi:hypothetical protein